MIQFYKDAGVPLALVDSDGWSEKLIPSWLDSGFDIVFPIEVGKWGANPDDLRKKFGRKLRMLGAIDKNYIYGHEERLHEHLLSLKPNVMEGGFIPIPDHRIPPQVSYRQMLRYIEIFHEVFN
jgi:uroporphyrinogen-III decarboxylase